MGRENFKTPACAINPRTELPYTRHDWEIVPGKLLKKGSLYYYQVRCKRRTCEINDPNLIGY